MPHSNKFVWVAHNPDKALAKPVLRHRILTNFTAASEGVTTETVIDKLIETTATHQGAVDADKGFKKVLTQA